MSETISLMMINVSIIFQFVQGILEFLMVVLVIMSCLKFLKQK